MTNRKRKHLVNTMRIAPIIVAIAFLIAIGTLDVFHESATKLQLMFLPGALVIALLSAGLAEIIKKQDT